MISLSFGDDGRRADSAQSLVWFLIIALAALALILVGVWYSRQPAPNRNALAIGARATATQIDIAIQAPVELDRQTKSQVLALRRDAARRYADLIVGEYAPADAVFGQIEDGAPWWGVEGQFYHGKGENSIAGAAEESRFILNPYLLVAAEFDGLTIWGQGAAMWNRALVTDATLRRADFPLFCAPSALQWQPYAARAQVTYDVTQCLARLNQWTTRRLGIGDAFFSLIAYNARDLNLSYLYLSPENSRNLTPTNVFNAPIAIPQFIHRGGSCSYPGGCNNMSPDTPEFDGIEIQRLPAQAVIWLWRDKPTKSTTPEMTFVIYFK